MTHQEAYLDEARELLVELESSFLELETTPQNQELIGRVFRALHTIKGSGAMFGFDRVAAFTHDVESAFELVRNGKLAVSPQLIELALAARDHIRELLDGGAAIEGVGITERLRNLMGCAGDLVAADSASTPPVSDPRARLNTFRIHFQPAADCFLKGTNPLLLLRELAEMGRADILARTTRLPGLQSLDPERCYTAWEILLTTSADENALRGVFLFVEDDAEVTIETVEAAPEKKLGEILIERGVAPAESIQAALAEQQHLRRRADPALTIRVPAEKLDQLVNIVGELVTVQARLSALANVAGDPELMFVAEEVERLTGKLREHSMSVRMLPIGETFNKFKRIVRDLSASLGKQVDLVTEGGDTELDKTVIDQLSDPLVHLIRNSIDHGIESPRQRTEAGKPERGTVVLSALHAGAHVLIRIRDDGAGLDCEAIRACAVERGIVAADAELTEEQSFALIFEPGFSTSKRITEVSGRGVGLDVVKKSIEALHGTLQIASTRGVGTTIALKLPLTLAIIDGLLVRVGHESFVLPLANIVGCMERTEQDIRDAHGKDYVVVRGEMVACIPLRRHFGIGGEKPAIEQVIIAETHSGKCGFAVDEVIGHHQTVIKKLGGLCRKLDLISGATILGDGTVALILDTDRLAAA
jgi:two-component system, chemotaxis family, sensor kinase CheA